MPTSTANHSAPPQHAGAIRQLNPRGHSRDAKKLAAQTQVLDPTVVQVAVELTMPRVHASARLVEPCLQALQSALQVDSVFVALFDRTLLRVSWVATSNANYQYCNPHELIGVSQPFNVELLQKLKLHHLLDIRDGTCLAGEYGDFCKQLLPLNLCSMLVGGISSGDRVVGFMSFGSLHRRNHWDMEIHLTMKLMTACYTAGLERSQLRAK
jgi:hypothetical protein